MSLSVTPFMDLPLGVPSGTSVARHQLLAILGR